MLCWLEPNIYKLNKFQYLRTYQPQPQSTEQFIKTVKKSLEIDAHRNRNSKNIEVIEIDAQWSN